MSRDSIQKIKETEDRAEQIVEDAKQRAREMVAAAERDGLDACERTERETAASIDQMMLQLRERTAAMSERMANEAEEEAAKMRADAALRKRSAEKIVIRGLTSKCR